jgi:DNA-binding NarL/FixJ family response regulator
MLESDPAFNLLELTEINQSFDLSEIDVLILAGWGAQPMYFYHEFKNQETFPPVLFISNEPDQLYSKLNGSNPVFGIVNFDIQPASLCSAVHCLSAGLCVLLPSLLTKPMRSLNQPEALVESLSPREQEILGYLAQGLSNKQIAYKLNISENTIKFHLSAIYAKLNANNRAEAVRLGAKHGLLTL